MLNHRRRLNPALSLAADAQGVRLQERRLRCRLVAGAPAAGLHRLHRLHRLHAASVEHLQCALQGL